MKPEHQKLGEDADCPEAEPLRTSGSQDLDLKKDEEGGQPVERAAWDNKLQFILSIIGYAVGLGNIWRFPYLCQQNGGGAFLIPYVILLFVEGIPMQFLEVAIGQRMRMGAIGVWNEVSPYLGGLGWSSVMVSYLVALYYNVLIMWSFFYLFSSFTAKLPWSECPTVTVGNETVLEPECTRSDPTSYFWYRKTLDLSPGIDQPNGIKWKMALCLLFTYIVTFLCLFKGIKTSGKVMYVTATFPYLVLTIFFGRAMFLPGAGAGLKHLFLPRVERLIDPQVWLDAGTQVFYSLGLGFGGLIAFASYTPIKNNCQRDTIFVCMANLATSLFSGIVIFAVLGFKAHNLFNNCLDRDIHRLMANNDSWFSEYNVSTLDRDTYVDVVLPQLNHGNYTNATALLSLEGCSMTQELDKAAQGTGLAFIVFTQAIVKFPAAPFWSIIFFLMLLTLGTGSMFGTIECVITSIYDLDPFPKSLHNKWKKPIITGITCLTSFLIGLLFVTGAGEYWVKLFDSFAGTFPLLFVAVLELFAISYVYGIEKFEKDIEFMLGHKPHKLWSIMWKYVCPFLMIAILIASLVTKTIYPIKYGRYVAKTASIEETEYPKSMTFPIILLALASPICVPVVAIYRKIRPSTAQRAKNAQIKTGGTTESTAVMMRQTDDDSGHLTGSDDVMVNFNNGKSQNDPNIKFRLGSDGSQLNC